MYAGIVSNCYNINLGLPWFIWSCVSVTVFKMKYFKIKSYKIWFENFIDVLTKWLLFRIIKECSICLCNRLSYTQKAKPSILLLIYVLNKRKRILWSKRFSNNWFNVHYSCWLPFSRYCTNIFFWTCTIALLTLISPVSLVLPSLIAINKLTP